MGFLLSSPPRAEHFVSSAHICMDGCAFAVCAVGVGQTDIAAEVKRLVDEEEREEEEQRLRLQSAMQSPSDLSGRQRPSVATHH